ncbi:MAG: ion channel [Clostridiales bacterium]|nr:ion channel [Clostridiales bacterium]
MKMGAWTHMKRKLRLYGTIFFVLAVVYLLLLLLLLQAEAANPQSSIRTLADAVWYSVVTLTTVGYGDITPVTTGGHAVGIIFLILSTGLLVTLVGTVFSFLSSEGFPLLMLSWQKKKNWYYFADMGQEANALAQQILEEDADAVVIFGQSKNSLEEKPDYPCMFINVSPERIARCKRGVGSRCKVFLMKENDIGVNPRAVNIARLPVEVYARTASGEDTLSGNIHFFHSHDCCAREYWRKKPLTSEEHQIVLIGFGNYGEALLTRAIMTNVISPEHHVTYHIFGDVGDFLHMHPGLGRVFSIQEEADDRDSLVFYEDSWTMHHALLAEADRIIICEDDEQQGWDILWHMRRYYLTRGRIDLRNSRSAPGISYFGTTESIYTPEHILRTTLNQVAIAMNNLYRRSHPDNSLDWDELEDYLKQSKIAASEHVYTKVRILLKDERITRLSATDLTRAYSVYRRKILDPDCLELFRNIEHQRWLRFYAFYNWTYGPVHNEERRQDPRICPYEDLSPEFKAYCDYSWELLGELHLKNGTES